MHAVEPLSAHILSADTQVILLLCGRFGPSQKTDAEPLTLSEYNALAQWLQRHGMRPADLLDDNWRNTTGVTADVPVNVSRLLALLERGGALALAVEGWTNKGLWVVSRSDDTYPQRLKARLGRLAPPLLYGVGDIDLLSGGGLAIVGSREADDETSAFARRIAQTCARQGVPVASGGARGVDSEAMVAALEADGQVVGVLADSLARAAVAGKYRRGLLANQLALVSPYDPGSGFNAGNAMGRNKHIYALADWAVVVSAAHQQGGTWSGAVEALKRANTSVFVRVQGAVPEGNHKLLDMGARPFPDEPWIDVVGQLSALAAPSAANATGQPRLIEEQCVPYQVEGSQASVTPPSSTDGAGHLVDRVPVEPGSSEPAPFHLEQSSPESVFAVVLPLMLSHLDQPRDTRSLAALLEVRPAQMGDWLNKAIEQGQVEKVGRSARYIARRQGRTLFPLDGYEHGGDGQETSSSRDVFDGPGGSRAK